MGFKGCFLPPAATQLAGGIMEAAKQRNNDLNVAYYSWDANKPGRVPE